MTTINHLENTRRRQVKLLSYTQDKDTASIQVTDKYGKFYDISFDLHAHDIYLDRKIKRSRYLKRIKSKVEIEELYGFLIGVMIDGVLLARFSPDAYPPELKEQIAVLDKKYQDLAGELNVFIKSFPVDDDAATACYKIKNKWLRVWARALVANNELPLSHLALQLKFLEAIDLAYAEDKYGGGWCFPVVELMYYLYNSENEKIAEYCDFAMPNSFHKQKFELCGIKTDNRLVLNYLDFIARSLHRVLLNDMDHFERNRSYNNGFPSSWYANSDEGEYCLQYRDLKLYKTENLLFPKSIDEAVMGRFLIETTKF